jgi:hypothetical protein
VLEWIGFFSLKDGERQWLDLAAQAVDTKSAACCQDVMLGKRQAGRSRPARPAFPG